MLQEKDWEKGDERYVLCLHNSIIDVLGSLFFFPERLLNLLQAKDEDKNEVQAQENEKSILNDRPFERIILIPNDCYCEWADKCRAAQEDPDYI